MIYKNSKLVLAPKNWDSQSKVKGRQRLMLQKVVWKCVLDVFIFWCMFPIWESYERALHQEVKVERVEWAGNFVSLEKCFANSYEWA